MTDWVVPPKWKGDTAFIVAGGPSVAEQDLSLLKGKHVIVINSSYTVVPDADYLIFADKRWYEVHHENIDRTFRGQVVSLARGVNGPKILGLKRPPKNGGPTPPMMDNPAFVSIQYTTLQSAINLAVHLGAVRVVLIGADMRRAPDGRSHHHAPHKWANKSGDKTWDTHMAHLRTMAKPLRKKGVEVINTSPVSRIDWWPKQSLADAVAQLPIRREPVGVKDSREYDMLKKRGFKDYSPGHQRMYLIPIEAIKATKKKLRIFEAGFGIGFGLDNFVKAGIVDQYVGCEPNKDSFDYVRQRHGSNPVLALVNAPFTPDLALGYTNATPGYFPFDVAFCIEVIEHVPAEHHAAFLAALRTLAPKLKFSTPDIDRYPKEGVRTTAEWEKMLKEAGFETVVVNTRNWTHLFEAE